MRWVLSDITQSSVSIIQIVWVPQMMVCLDEFWIMVFVTRWFKNWWQSSKIKTAETCFQNSKTITQWHVHKPLFFFSPSPVFFLSLFFFIHSSFFSSSEQKTHTHRSLTCTVFFLLSFDSVFFMFFLFCSFCSSPTGHSHADPSREIIGVDLWSHAEKLHHVLVLLITAIVLVLRSGRSIEIGIHSNNGSPLEKIQSRSSIVGVENSSIGSSFLIWKRNFIFLCFLFRGVS